MALNMLVLLASILSGNVTFQADDLEFAMLSAKVVGMKTLPLIWIRQIVRLT
jgi:hypothetical protein